MLNCRRVELGKAAQLRGALIILRLVDVMDKLRCHGADVEVLRRLRNPLARSLEADITLAIGRRGTTSSDDKNEGWRRRRRVN